MSPRKTQQLLGANVDFPNFTQLASAQFSRDSRDNQRLRLNIKAFFQSIQYPVIN
jgi:hypothetical protein